MIKREVMTLQARISKTNRLFSFLFLFIIGLMIMFSMGIMIIETIK